MAAEHASQVARAIADTAHLLALIAAPRVLASDASNISAQSIRSELHRHIAEVIAGLARDWTEPANETAPRLPAFMAELKCLDRLLLARQDQELSTEEIDAARRTLAALGIEEPEGGWETWDGRSIE